MLMPMLWRKDNDNYDVMNPFDEMDHMLNDFWGDSFNSDNGLKTDVIDEGDKYRLEADLPGFDKSDIGIELQNDMLTISASHNENKDEKDKNGKYVRRERRSSSYTRSFKAEGLKPEDIDAKYENGVLSITVPKKQALPKEEDIKKIEIKG